jgi:hypothetical protein
MESQNRCLPESLETKKKDQLGNSPISSRYVHTELVLVASTMIIWSHVNRSPTDRREFFLRLSDIAISSPYMA